MSERARSWLAVALIAASLGTIIAVLATGPPSPEDRANALASRLKCPICENESIAASPAQVARDSYELIEERIAEGWSDQEIVDFFVQTYGQSVLLDPPAGGSTAPLWIAPLAALAIGAVVLIGRRRVGSARELTQEERDRVAAELEARR